MPTFYINADTGDDVGGDGSEGSPWETLSHAHDQATDGDTIVCQDATATYAFVDQIFSKDLTVRGEQDDASGAVFDGGGAGVGWRVAHQIVTLEKLTLQNAVVNSNTAPIFATISSGSADTEFSLTNCKLLDLGVGALTSGRFLGNDFVGTANVTVTVVNCVIEWDGGSFVMGGNGSGVHTFTVTNTAFSFQDGANYPDFVFNFTSNLDGASTLTIRNTIFRNNTGQTVEWADEENISWDVSYSDINNISTLPSAVANGDGVITSDPLFVDEANGNFNLRPDSPCISTGTLV